MHRTTPFTTAKTLTLIFGLATAVGSCAPAETGTLRSASEALGVSTMRSIEYSGTGRWFQFGQAPNPTLPWPAFEVSRFAATVSYEPAAARVEMVRRQIVEPGRQRPAPVEQRPVQLVSGTYAWNLAAPAAGGAPVPTAALAAVEERTAEIWITPHGFLKAAAANNSTSQPVTGGGSDVSFTVGGKYRYTGRINAQNQVERVQTWIDNAVLGDTLIDTAYSGYRAFGNVTFPERIVRTQGGHPLLELTVTAVTANPTVSIDVPEPVRTFSPPPITVDVEKLADGVYYLRGGGHHSIAIDQRDHIVVVEGPLSEARSLAVIAKAKETIPNKPIKYVINSHVHFDHSGGLRTYVDEGATIVTHEMNRPYYETAWNAPRTLNPDRLATSKKSAAFETLKAKHVLTDGKRAIEVHPIEGNGHNDAFVMVYLPTEKLLFEVDAWAPPAAGTAPPAPPSPFAVNLYENITKLKLDVRRIAALHGPGVATLDDLRKAVGQASSN